MALIAPFNITK